MSETIGQEPTPAAPGRRERNKQEKQQRIFDAAAELFAAHGYAAVTTQQIAERADVAAGTLFRYAASKAELLLMVHNEYYRRALATAERALPRSADVADCTAALLTPIVESGRQSDENTAAYQQAVMFGGPSDRYRGEALELIARLQERLAATLAEAWAGRHPLGSTAGEQLAAPDAAAAARAIFAVLQLETAHATLTAVPLEQQLDDILNQVDVITRGYLHTAPAHNAIGAPEPTDPSRLTSSKEQGND
ncbi:TetR family transcriptional regulator [Microterricola gilva]|uniref:TetR family transcriptional regulator n=1 Tax=Microterricola gilva TaxID=393267 RepID=A0A4Q8APR1_9MICO|nr:TetR/AcrR family transcriptional regulator [Microterricola gilva]RZU66015.1 TetR family transcriptional regulator [Microterricola gilva]